jgi:hypothetical protein
LQWSSQAFNFVGITGTFEAFLTNECAKIFPGDQVTVGLKANISEISIIKVDPDGDRRDIETIGFNTHN